MQEAQMELFKNDITTLSTKTKMFPPICKQEEKLAVSEEASSYDSEDAISYKSVEGSRASEVKNIPMYF